MPQTGTYILPDLSRKATLTVNVQMKDDKDNIINQSVLVKIECRAVAARVAGILLHPTSLPGPYGIGDLGAEAIAFLDFLHETGQGLWQVLPLGPTGYGDSPYSSLLGLRGQPAARLARPARRAGLARRRGAGARRRPSRSARWTSSA